MGEERERRQGNGYTGIIDAAGKMLRDGIETLSDVELLALFCVPARVPGCADFSHSLLQRFGSLYGLLSAEIEQFADIDGIGIAKYAQLKGIAELARRYFSLRMREEPSLVTPLMTREFYKASSPMKSGRSLWRSFR